MGTGKGMLGRAGDRCGLGAWTSLGVLLGRGLLLGTALLLATPAHADWRLYTSADTGYSIGHASADGQITQGPTLSIGGSDDDVSPLFGGAFGIAIPMDELAPLEMPRGWRLPQWDTRFEIEAVGLREYDFTTRAVAGTSSEFLTKVETWSLMSNVWLDVPLRGLYRPISWTSSRLFGRWRLRTLRYILDRTTLNMGVGIGVAHLDAKTTESDIVGKDDVYNFAWQAGVGFGYQVSDRVNLGLGYRYIDPGDVKYDLESGSLNPADDNSFKIDPEIHEVRASVRVEIWDFAMPWR